jgi:putative redox protein
MPGHDEDATEKPREMPMSEMLPPSVIVTESANGPYGETITAGRHVLSADEPESVGGRDSGPTPYEHLLAGLGACTAMTLRMYAKRHNWPLKEVSVALAHEKIPDAESGSRIDRFQRVITLTGPLSEAQRERLLEIAAHCPVSQTLGRASVLSTALAAPGAAENAL